MMKRNIGYTVAALVLATGLCAPLPAQDKSALIDPDSIKALNDMAPYLRTLKDFQVSAEVTTEDVLTDGQKLQYAHKTDILAHLPTQLRIDVDGEKMSRLYLYDGKSFTLFARRSGYYATVPAPPTIGQLIDVAYEKYDIVFPLMDLFMWGTPRANTDEITAAEDFGPGVVEGVTCEHYAYRQPGLDWQVWVQLGNHPLPRKLVLTTMTDEARPQHSQIINWNLAPSYNEAAFVFDPPPGAQKIVFAENKDASAGN